MELWIRSQDKQKLIRCNSIRYVYHMGVNMIIEAIKEREEAYTILGEYSTEKQALEVLDEIQKLLTPKIIINNDFLNENMSLSEMTHITAKYMQHCRENILVDQINQVVYQMPEDKGADYDTI